MLFNDVVRGCCLDDGLFYSGASPCKETSPEPEICGYNIQVTIKVRRVSDVFEDKIGRASTGHLPGTGEFLDIFRHRTGAGLILTRT